MRNPIIEEDLKNITNFNLPWYKFYGKTVLVTGAAGMLAAYIVETLLYLNETKAKPKIKILALVRNKKRALERFKFYRGRKDLKFIEADVSQSFKIAGKVDYIFHAASNASPKFYGVDPVGTLLPNVLGTYQILELARTKKIMGLLFFSSAEIYGNPDRSTGRTIGEGDYGYLDPMSIRSCYAESKRMGETMCLSWYWQYGVPIKIIRPFHTYGPGMKLNDGRVFADFVNAIVNNRNITLNSDGKAVRPFCYLADAVIGFFTVLLKGEDGQAYNVANNRQLVSILNLAKILTGLFPEKKLKVIQKKHFSGYLKSPVFKIFPSIEKISKLGWQPKVSAAQGFKRTIESYKHKY
jgi:UDP-glucuronate decarboxylase